MSDFLNFTDEVIDGTPKYTITDNGDGTKGIALANTVITQGTALNKGNLEAINNAIGYATPSYTTTSLSAVTLDFTTGTYSNAQIPNNYNIPIYTYSNSSLTTCKDSTVDSSNIISGRNENDSYTYISPNNFLYGVYYKIPSNIASFDFLLDDPYTMLYGYTDLYMMGVSLKSTTTYNTWYTYTNDGTYKYFAIARPDGGSNDIGYLKNFKLDNCVSVAYTLPRNVVTNNAIINIYVPTGISGNIIENTFNGKAIDTLLESGKYYELMYNSTSDKFIAYETRV